MKTNFLKNTITAVIVGFFSLTALTFCTPQDRNEAADDTENAIDEAGGRY